jgi:hypothetical protein
LVKGFILLVDSCLGYRSRQHKVNKTSLTLFSGGRRVSTATKPERWLPPFDLGRRTNDPIDRFNSFFEKAACGKGLQHRIIVGNLANLNLVGIVFCFSAWHDLLLMKFQDSVPYQGYHRVGLL